MAQEPDRIRRDIEQTRAELTRDVDRLADKTNPTRVAQRRWTAVKEKVMGTSNNLQGTAQGAVGTVQDRAQSAAGTVQDRAQSAAGTVQDKAQDAAEAVRSAPRAVARQTGG